MLLESLCCKAGALRGEFVDATPFAKTKEGGGGDGKSEKKKKKDAATAAGDALEELGFSRLGAESLVSGVTGERFEADIFLGPVYYQRLRHMVRRRGEKRRREKKREKENFLTFFFRLFRPRHQGKKREKLTTIQYQKHIQVSDKFQVRSVGPVNPLTRQPVKGRKAGGGVRFGEMERDALLSHGAAYLLHDRLHLCSDYGVSDVCGRCGSVLTPAAVQSVGGSGGDGFGGFGGFGGFDGAFFFRFFSYCFFGSFFRTPPPQIQPRKTPTQYISRRADDAVSPGGLPLAHGRGDENEIH